MSAAYVDQSVHISRALSSFSFMYLVVRSSPSKKCDRVARESSSRLKSSRVQPRRPRRSEAPASEKRVHKPSQRAKDAAANEGFILVESDVAVTPCKAKPQPPSRETPSHKSGSASSKSLSSSKTDTHDAIATEDNMSVESDLPRSSVVHLHGSKPSSAKRGRVEVPSDSDSSDSLPLGILPIKNKSTSGRSTNNSVSSGHASSGVPRHAAEPIALRLS
ncbi:hypothetical protein CPB84DRAFT_1753975 [Gymnopilus junonius]|uniref:Uncharacterized protein n=1 Tax=Gymnopilus junonius TaxID=109634 RepID=A0A9P5N7A6_GYMJU|nr:hypothetical protein CPB84DRAFT_1753975 [Gymnopilus junonius]